MCIRDRRHQDDHRGEHRRDLAPGVDAPPVPAENENEARAASEREEEPPRALDRREIQRHDDRSEKQTNRRPTRNGDVMLLACFLSQKSLVDVSYTHLTLPTKRIV